MPRETKTIINSSMSVSMEEKEPLQTNNPIIITIRLRDWQEAECIMKGLVCVKDSCVVAPEDNENPDVNDTGEMLVEHLIEGLNEVLNSIAEKERGERRKLLYERNLNF